MPPPASIVQVCEEHGPESPHSTVVAHNCGNATLQDDRQVPAVDIEDAVITRQQSPASPQEEAEVHELPELPESISV
jgi:hypothetical protein